MPFIHVYIKLGAHDHGAGALLHPHREAVAGLRYLKRKLLCVKYTKRLMGSISRAVLGQLHDGKINRILAGQRRKSNRAAGGGKHRHHKRRIIVDVCGNCTAKDRQHEWHPPRTQPSRRRHWVPFQQSLKQRTPLGGERNINIGLGGPGLPGNIRRGDG